jgi:hypothetical protein
VSFFYEIRSSNNTLLKRDGSFANEDAAKETARADAKKMKSVPNLIRSEVADGMLASSARPRFRPRAFAGGNSRLLFVRYWLDLVHTRRNKRASRYRFS